MRIAFLGYNPNQTQLHDFLMFDGCSVEHYDDELNAGSLQEYDHIISYGYRNIIKNNVLIKLKKSPINLHISLLPFNRGAHPNFWSFHDGTPHGVTIHYVEKDLDCGKIIAQKEIKYFSTRMTFSFTYRCLRSEIESLFMECWESIKENRVSPRAQSGEGSFHYKKDLPVWEGGWNEKIEQALGELRKTYGEH